MATVEKVKRTRKPKVEKVAKEEHSNIDCITLQNTELELELEKERENDKQKDTSTSTLETPATKPKKTPVPRKKKEPKPELEEIIQPIIPNQTITTTQPTTTQPITTFPYTTHITNIYHISDLHIQLYKRHDEYQAVFEKVYTYLKNEKKILNIPEATNTNIPLVSVITGDLLHSKSDLSPECVQLTYNFIKTLSTIMPIIIIPGNHDINMNNKERLDSLTPIISDLPKANPIYYFLDSGVYQLSNLVFYHASIFDYQIIPPIPQITQKNTSKTTSIMLYHGRVNGAVQFNGLEITENSNKTVTPSTFAPYDITCLGDIHKHQFLSHNIAYAGSLIQQNHGEDVNNHGLIKWDVANKSGTFIPITNDWSYITLFVENRKANHQCSVKDKNNIIHDPNCELMKNLRIRILYKNTPESYIMDYITLLKMNHNIHEFSYQNNENITGFEADINEEDLNDDSNATLANKGARGAEALVKGARGAEALVMDITSPELQNKFLIEHITQNEPNVSVEEMNQIKEINITQNELLKSTNKNYNTQGFTGHYKLKRLEFSNLFSYGTNNVIDFTEFKGIVGIIAPNHMGKSAILDIIIFALFDTFSRKGSTKDIVNIRADFYSLKLEAIIGQWTYTIYKTGTRGKTNSIPSKIEFYRTNETDNIIERLEEDTAMKTKERISEYFGTYDNIIHTSFSIQQDNSCFIDAENTERRKELQRIMRFDIIDKLYEMANHTFNKFKGIREHISKKIDNDFIVATKKSKVRASRALELHTENKAYAKEKIKELNKQLLEASVNINTECASFMKENNQLESEEMLEDLTARISDIESEMDGIEKVLCDKRNNNKNTFNIELIEKSILDDETKQYDIIKNENIVIKKLDKDIETLYKSLKPINNKISIDSATGASTDINSLKTSYETKINSYKKQISSLDTQINKIKENEQIVVSNNIKILDLEKQMSKLPDTLLNLIDPDAKKQYEDAMDKYLEKILDLTNNNNNNHNHNIKQYIIINEYKEFESSARAHFLSDEIATYMTTNETTNDDLIEQQNDLETENTKLQNELKSIKSLEAQMKELEGKVSNINIKIQQLNEDFANREYNVSIDNDINVVKNKKRDAEKAIENSNKVLQTLKNKTRMCNTYRQLCVNKKSLEKELLEVEDILSKFDEYKMQIDSNKNVQDKVDSLKAELVEFEEVYEEVERQFNTESTNVTKYTAQLDQIRKDVAENKSIDNNLKIYDIYRKSLKALPYILLAKVQPVLEKKVNDLLSIITDFTVKFDMSDNKIDIYIDRPIYRTENRYILVNNGSGFERFVASLAIRIALLDMSNLPKINFMAIDEGWSSFDTHNINNVGIILDYLKTKFDFILTISHLIQIKEHCDVIISLKKNEKGFSQIVKS